ncbi:hypothetical protein [Chelativorans sp. Marseille-P2723]|uniref:hypothetical protein n=1 Tax=Chelativorans sp. Marseille-P2723 TaxID=2709133 RepID=UPI00157098E9|nr:hypothetical protein [Chelativorans sp. Marseille-P2723]
MNIKALLAVVATLGLAGPALAQTTGAIGDTPEGVNSGHDGWSSPEEQRFYERHNETLIPFFTTQDFQEIRSADEMRTAWATLPADRQVEIRTDCGSVLANPGAFGERTVELCNQLQGM